MAKSSADVSFTIRELTSRLDAAAAAFVPWFLEQMPEAYFENIDEASRLEHMGAILAIRAAGQEPWLRIKSGDGRRITVVLSRDAPGTLSDLVRDFGDEPIRAARIYSSKDEQLVVDTFDLGESPLAAFGSPEVQTKLRAAVAHAEGLDRGAAFVETLAALFGRASEDYVRDVTPLRACRHAVLDALVRRSGGAEVVLEDEAAGRSRIVLAAAGVAGKGALMRVANRLGTLGINIVRAYVDTLGRPGEEPVTIVSAVVVGPDKRRIDPGSALWAGLRGDLLRLMWLDAATIELGYRVPSLGLGGADILACYAELAHQLLVRSNRYVYSRARIREVVAQQLPLARRLVALFLLRFDPAAPATQGAFDAGSAEVRRAIAEAVDDEASVLVLETMLGAIGYTLRTNYFVERRYALSLRLAPEVLEASGARPEAPYGLFWVHGRGFDALHLRFRETSRGGVRVVRPASAEQHVRECERLLDEAYDLAYAQQLKNKDIPEGGAKAVILAAPGQDPTPCVRAFADAVLDLLTPDPATRARVADRYGVEERLYFGPDENITPDHINWIVRRARDRGYPSPNALMSSKPGAGINHKEFGVTSEGVNVFLEVCLLALGIDPRKQSFTLKLTGGPDGDVGGNEIRIAIREFGANVKIVGVADGLGCAEDPGGLDHGELLRLVDESASIVRFDEAKLSPLGKLTRVTDPDGARTRNELHNRVVADAFIPAGGRPGTMHAGNWARFLKADGAPSSRLIVEGANLFITAEARQRLFEAGVVVVKDSSANKCGVICSSYEVAASLLLSEDEFLAIKPVFVAEVLERLRKVARLEAEQLLEASRRRPTTPLVELSILLSREINRLTDAIAADYAQLAAAHPAIVDETVLAHLPPALAAIAADRVLDRLPATYRAQIVCTSLASRIVYREGLDYFRDTPDASLASLAIEYVRREQRTRELVAAVCASGLAEADEVASLLRIGGTRSALGAAWKHRE